jgi:CheY-like chemotaxis protein
MTEKEKPTILIVDDEPELIMLLRVFLEKSGYQVIEASNGAIALELLKITTPGSICLIPMPDLVILDIMMPVMDGYTLNTRLQADERTSKVPILVLTAKGQKMRDIFEMAPNVAAYVQKPFNAKALAALIANILAGNKK